MIAPRLKVGTARPGVRLKHPPGEIGEVRRRSSPGLRTFDTDPDLNASPILGRLREDRSFNLWKKDRSPPCGWGSLANPGIDGLR